MSISFVARKHGIYMDTSLFATRHRHIQTDQVAVLYPYMDSLVLSKTPSGTECVEIGQVVR